DLDLANLRPETLVVRDQVRLQSPDVAGAAAEELKLTFVPQPFDHPQQSAQTPQQSAQRNLFPGSAREDGDSRNVHGFTHFSCDSIEASLDWTRDDRTARATLQNLWLNGNVQLDHTTDREDRNFSARGNFLFAEGGLQDNRKISLFGSPATVSGRLSSVEGPRILLSEQQEQMKVDGSGRLRLVVDRGFDGKPLPRPTPLEIYWGGQMEFQGTTARFDGDIRAVMKDGSTQDLEVTCAALTVTFAESVRLRPGAENAWSVESAAAGSDDKRPADVSRLQAEGRVSLRFSQLEQGNPIGLHRAEMSDFDLDTTTGAFSGTGPGWIESTQPDSGGDVRVAPVVVARSNTAVRVSEQAFMYVKASFIGSVSGNIDSQLVTLQQHVSAVFGPVRHLGETVDVAEHTTAALPEQTGILRCEELSVSAIPGEQPDSKSFSLLARQNASLEMRQLSGDADVVSYDHSKEQFILRTDGDHLATVLHRAQNGGDVRRVDGKRFEYYPGQNQLNAHEIFRVRAAQ
ncbi:MAG: hypothetical protein KDA96_24425, partial [Planctomycetaceae bacterium]|nr:hypothetical protein [Planctomycetaceae bacterium]